MKIFNLPITYILILIPFFSIGLFFVYKYYLSNKKFNKSGLAQMRNYSYSEKKFKFKIFLLIISFVLLFISILRPAWGEKTKMLESKGTDIVFTLDVSKSMKALDVGGGSVDRLTMAKAMIGQFVSDHPENRYGLVIFAGEAFVSTPLTVDTSAFLTFLDGVNYRDVGKQGTNIEAALQASIDRFYSEQDKARGRSVVIISDGGEKTEGDITPFAKVCKKLNIKIFTIGIGSTKEVPIPEGQDVFGRISYKKYQGKIVMTKLNEKILKQIAKETDGEYFHAKNKNDLEQIAKKLETLEATVIKTEAKMGHEDRFQYFLFPSFLFFIFYLFFDLITKNFSFNIKIKKYLKMAVIILPIFALTGCSTNNLAFRYYNNAGNKSYNNEYYKEAIDKYLVAGEKSRPLKYISDNNKSLAYYKKEDYEQAVKTLEEATTIYCQKEIRENCDYLYYNLGNAYYKQGETEAGDAQSGKWQKAITSYKKDLEINKGDSEAQENIDFILSKIKQEKEKNNQDNKADKNSDNSQDSKNSESSDSSDNKNSENSQNKQNGAKQEDGNSQDVNKDKGGGDGQKNSDDKSKQGEDSSASQGGKSKETSNQPDSAKIDEKTNKQVEEYMNNLDKQAQSNQDYFQPNPNGSYDQGNSFDDFFNNSLFNDPFFSDFLGNTNPNNGFGSKKEDNGIDW